MRAEKALKRLAFVMADDDEQAANTSGGDGRLEFFHDYLTKTLKIKGDKWSKFLGNEEARQTLMDFFEKPENRYLVVYLSSSGQLAASECFPGSNKQKAVYFIKNSKLAISSDNIRSAVAYGDLSYAPLDHLSAVVEDVS